MARVYDKFYALESKNIDPRTRRYLTPKRIVYTKGLVSGADILLSERSNQISLFGLERCVLENKAGQPHAAILIDFGIEFSGSLRIMAWQVRGDKAESARLLVRFGESVSEAMTPVGEKNATNDHANREMILEINQLSANETNESGFRFAYVELLDDDGSVFLKSLQGVFAFRDIEYKGSFQCSDPLLNKIWNTAAYTVHLCMQEYLWDGIKRDRLVWIGDMHPEVLTILAAFGDQQIIRDSLDLVRDENPKELFMNGTAAYSIWWILIQEMLYRTTGDFDYLEEQKIYLTDLMRKLIPFVDEEGKEQITGWRFLDWHNENNPAAKHAGLQGLMKLGLDTGASLLEILGDGELAAECKATAARMKNYIPHHESSKQVAALLALSGLEDAKKMNDEVISRGGTHGYSTFFGYYILAAKAQAGDFVGALDDIREYWGAMLKMGATTFWEDFDLDWLENSSPIDEIVPEGKNDIHGDFGKHCYTQLRHSLCHGWASGPCPYLSHYVLGIRPVSHDTYRIDPELSGLDWARGSYPTAYGNIEIELKKTSEGTAIKLSAPKEIKIVR